MMKPIETEYKGYKFRSRLEARWAVFFDALKWKWVYEPEGFELSNGMWYLPDFKITKFLGVSDIYIEVKPEIPYPDSDDAIKVTEMNKTKNKCAIVVGDPVDSNGIFAMPIEMKDEIGISLGKLAYSDEAGYFLVLFDLQGFGGVISKKGLELFNYVNHSEWEIFIPVFDHPKIIDAQKKARQARFEHGEKK